MVARNKTAGKHDEGLLSVDVQIACRESGIPSEDEIRSWVRRAAIMSGRTPVGPADVAVRIVGTDEIRRLNRDYRYQDAATNVLSFPADPIAGLPAEVARILGDIVICAAVVRAEATGQGKPLSDHWCHMVVHGTLHLLGFDHQDQAEATTMEAIEAKILEKQGIADPYSAS